MGSHTLGASKRRTPPWGSDSGGSCDINSIVFPPVESMESEKCLGVFKGEVIPVTSNNICSYSSLDKGN